MPKGKPTGETCSLCGEPILSGQLVSGCVLSTAPPLSDEGARTSNEGYHEGHHACVLQALGPDETLKAIHDGRLPVIDPAVLVDGCLPTTAMGGI